MKAQYILAAIQAMREAEKELQKFDVNDYNARWRVSDRLRDARIDLLIRSGLSDVEVTVEQEVA